jgi:hypothetical protein
MIDFLILLHKLPSFLRTQLLSGFLSNGKGYAKFTELLYYSKNILVKAETGIQIFPDFCFRIARMPE